MKSRLEGDLRAAFAQLGSVPPDATTLEKPRHAEHGDFSCPLPMTLAKSLRRPPLSIAQQVADDFTPPPFVARVQVAKPGFINFYFNPEAKTAVIGEILNAADAYGKNAAAAAETLVEFVSANPTGPLHVGHGRACAYGDTLANILDFVGCPTRREYYINNAGRQTVVLAASVWLRYWRAQPNHAESADAADAMPRGAYRGDYLIAIAAADSLRAALADSAPPPPTLRDAMRQAADDDAAADLLIAAATAAVADIQSLARRICDEMMETVIKADMRALNVATDRINFFAESQLQGRAAAAVAALRDGGHLYEQDGALWFASSRFGDDKDRVVRRSNGEFTYFTADIAYHADKYARMDGKNNGDGGRMINVLGADHHGYVPRLRASVAALGHDAARLETRFIQFVSLLEDGKRIKMSTRAGEFITLRELVDRIGADAARYFFISRKNDQHLDFDIKVAQAQNANNPFYYIQYAYARIHSIFRKWGGSARRLRAARAAALADDDGAARLCGQLAAYPDLLADIARQRAPHLLAAFLHDLATALHTYYETTRILPAADNDAAAGSAAAEDDMTLARLAMLQAVATVIGGGMRLLGIRLQTRMDKEAA